MKLATVEKIAWGGSILYAAVLVALATWLCSPEAARASGEASGSLLSETYRARQAQERQALALEKIERHLATIASQRSAEVRCADK